MLNQFSRTQLLIGAEGMERLYHARVAVFGLGGVGGYAVEALARSGIGTLDLTDDDRVCLTNLNRQHCICPPGTARKCTQRRQVPGSNAFVPAVAGLILAGEVVKDLSGWEAQV